MKVLRVGATALLTLVLLAGCIGQEKRSDQGFTSLDLAQIPSVTLVPTSVPATAVAIGQGGVTGVIPPTSTKTLSSSQLVDIQPDELGVIPVFMYHAITSADHTDDLWTRTVKDFRSDLQWLYDHDFYVVSMREVLTDAISAPPGKHPVLLTFDDASSGQFQFEKDAKGDLVPTPDSTIGVMEDFYAKHPDFGHSGLFALLPYNCFSSDADYNTIDYCDQKLNWLSDHGYEIGNHTWGHQDLSVVDADEIASQIGQTMDFIDEHVKGPGNMSRVLVLPYGAMPDPNVDWWAWATIYQGFTWNGEDVTLDAVVDVNGGVVPSPASTAWDPYTINRFNTEPDLIKYWFDEFENGDLVLYTSDGNPQTVVVPDNLPDQLAEDFDPDALAASGKTALTYDPKSGDVAVAHDAPKQVASVDVQDRTARHRDRVAGFDVSSH
ncbi:MAG: polysaccharide deacetylase family protein [Thermomicrobiales bacterium]